MAQTSETPANVIANNLAKVQAEIEAGCQRAGRRSDDVQLVAVTKKRASSEILAALEAGVRHIGENRIEEALGKMPQVAQILPDHLEAPIWHMIGHVQSRKARDVTQQFSVVHSLDSLKLARRYDNFRRQDLPGERPLTVLLEMNVSGEMAKYGIEASRWKEDKSQRAAIWQLVEEVNQFEMLHIAGLMTMAPFVDDAEIVRPVFIKLRELRDALAADFASLDWQELSMGMTNDYPVAIEEGATMVRIGRAIFGERPQ
jgi:hypothetical protein